jgi:hypothetical protein
MMSRGPQMLNDLLGYVQSEGRVCPMPNFRRCSSGQRTTLTGHDILLSWRTGEQLITAE